MSSIYRIKSLIKSSLLLTMYIVFGQISYGQIVINEFSAANYDDYQTSNGQYEDWIELYNQGAAAVNLSGYYLSDRVNSPTKWKIPAGVNIPSKGRVIFIASGEDKLISGVWHTNFKITQTDKKEAVVLSSASGTVIDFHEIDVPNLMNHAYARMPDGGNWVITDTPTPTAKNASTYTRYAETPDFDIPAGYYATAQTVTLTTPEPSSEIRYTLDGTDPVKTSTLYTGPILINATKVLKTRTYSSDKTIFPSHIEVNSYFIGAANKHSIKVVSITGDNVQALLNGTYSSPFGTFELFDETGMFLDECTGEFNKHGNDSWAYNQRGIDYVTRDQFGNDSEIHEKLFKNSDRKDFQRIILKAAANDNYPALGGGAHIRDAYVHELAQRAGMDLDVRSYEPCILYVNGKYWGVYELREKVDDKDYTDYYYNLDEKEIDFIKTWGSTWAEYGTVNNWNTLKAYILSNDMTDPVKFKYVSDRLNLLSLADYFIINIHTVCKDWLNWNTSWWGGSDAKGNSQKWRYTLWDMDATFGHYINYTNIPNVTATADPCDIEKLGQNSDPQDHTDVLSKLFQNKAFHDMYINRYADLNNTYLSCSYMVQLLDELIAKIDPEMQRQIARWGGNYNTWKGNVQTMRKFILDRCVEIEDGLVDCYQLTGPYDLTVIVQPVGSPNDVKVNTLVPPSYPYDAKYYGGTDLSFQAQAGTGWVFDKWVSKKMALNPNTVNPDISSQIKAPDTLFAYFKLVCPTKIAVTAAAQDYIDCKNTTVHLLTDVQLGSKDYEYTWKDPSGAVIADSIKDDIYVSAPGMYIIAVKDKVLGCTQLDTFIVKDQKVLPVVAISTTEKILCSDPEANILSTGSDAGANFAYEWKGPCLKNPVTDLTNEACQAGTYELIITNTVNGCTSSKTINIVADLQIPNDVSISAVQKELPCDGTGVVLNISGTGPKGNYGFNWTSPSGNLTGNPTSGTVIAMSTEWYYVQVTNPDNGCIHNDSIKIDKNTNAPNALDLVLANPACQVATNGSIQVNNVTGGTGPFNYSLNGGVQTTNSVFSSLASGNYIISIEDSKKCTYDTTINLKIVENIPSDPVIALSGPSCQASINGTVEVTGLSKGTGPYQYSINNGAFGTQTQFTNLPAGNVIISIMDNNLCVFDTTLTLNITNDIPSDPIIYISAPSCDVALNGSVEVTGLTKGAAPYQYSINNGAYGSQTQFTNLPEGSVVISIKDNNACVFDTTLVLKNANDIPSDPVLDITVTSCNVATNGSLEITGVSKGTAPYVYSINNGPYNSQVVFNNLPAGNVSISIKDNNACVFDTTVVIKVGNDIPDNPVIDVSGPSCDVAFNGSFEIKGITNGTAPYTYSLTGSNYNANTQYNGLSSGDISLYIKDSNGCVYDTTFQLKVVEDLPDDLEVDVYAPACPEGTNGSIEIIAVNGGNGPYEFVLDGVSKGSISNYKDLKEGVYNLNIIDANGCEKDTTIDLTGGKPLSLDLGPDQEVDAGSLVNINPVITGKDITSIEWSPVICANCNGISVTVDRDTLITATITDAGGCKVTDEVALSIIFKTEIFTPNAFSPNGDGINDSWSLMTANTFAKINKLQIFDRWGGLVFNVANVLPGDKSSAWDGKISGKIVNSGVFVYVAEVNLGNGETVILKGDITVYR